MKSNEEVFRTDEMYLPIHYKGMIINEPAYLGDGIYSVEQLEGTLNTMPLITLLNSGKNYRNMKTIELELLETNRRSISNFNSLVSCSIKRKTLIKYLQRMTGLDVPTCHTYVLDYYSKTDLNEAMFNAEIKEQGDMEE